MDNRIQSLRVWNGRLDPAEAEVWITVRPDQLTSTTQVHGRLVGPRCAYSSTVEVAYPLREQSRQYEGEGEPRLTMRVIIPEPCLWDPQSPFLYEILGELRQSGKVCEQFQIKHGLCTLKLTPQGLRWNGRPLVLRGKTVARLTEEEARSLHQQGFNTLLAAAAGEAGSLWDSADRFGFLMLGRVERVAGYTSGKNLSKHTCCLGWVLDSAMLEHPIVSDVRHYPGDFGQLIGVELATARPQPLPEGIHFIVCDEPLLSRMSEVKLPKVVRRKMPADQATVELPSGGECLGLILDN